MQKLMQLGFEFNGQRISPDSYGADYIQEFVRILDEFAPEKVAMILEWGSGLTTQILAQYASLRWNTELCLSIDDNPEYQASIFRATPAPPCVLMKSLDLAGPCRNQEDDGLNYSSFPLSLGRTFDFIFIDGRRRVECAFIASILANSDSIVVLHDYRRARYQPMKALFEVIEDGSQFRVMRLHAGLSATLLSNSTEMRGQFVVK